MEVKVEVRGKEEQSARDLEEAIFFSLNFFVVLFLLALSLSLLSLSL